MHPCLSNALRLGAVFALVAACGGSPERRSRPQPASGPGTLITREDLDRHPGESIERILQRKVPGLVVRRTRDGGIALQIRGATSYDGSSTAPLYILNDMPVEPGPGGSLPGLDPREIESIRVLKGPDTALYGIRGLNGVIVIRTRGP